MNKYLILPIFLLVCLALLTVPTMADGVDDHGDPNDPTVNERANACYDGGTLANLCNSTDLDGDKEITEFDTDWMWKAGWYLIRYEYDLISIEDFPDLYRGVIGNQGGGCTVTPLHWEAMGLSSPEVTIPSDVLNGSSDPNDKIGVTPYGFDWVLYLFSGGYSIDLRVIGPSGSAALFGYYKYQDGRIFGGWYDTQVIIPSCPDATPPASLIEAGEDTI
ncbi:MAG TPA: hypothetical protein VHL11_12660 [Phototrophicaceae bacterium]|jgi:hypothetical protein|nr:hypothetical protein [Phototrophicaceae bacterium]